MLGDAFDYPKAGDDWLPTVLIGGILPLLGFLILPAFVVQGYQLRVMRDAAAGGESAPSFTEWGTLLVDGLKLFVVNLVYAFVVLIPIGVGVVVLGGTGVLLGDSEVGALVTGLAGIAFVGLVVVFGLLLAYLVPAAMANLAIEGRLGAAFAVGTIRRGAFTGEYATAWLLGLLVAVVGGLVGSALSVVVVGIFVIFYVQVMTYYLWGRGFAEGLGEHRRDIADTQVAP